MDNNFLDILRYFCEKGIVLDDDAEYGLASLAANDSSPDMFRVLLGKDHRSALEVCYEACSDPGLAARELEQLAYYSGSFDTDSDKYLFYLSRDYRKP